MLKKRTLFLLVCMLAFAQPLSAATIKIASLAPKGSTWMKYLAKMGIEVHKKSPDLRLKYYWGGIQGDETVVVEKMKANQLQGAVLTAIGLSKILPDALAYQLPMLFRDDQELDQVRAKLDAWFQQKFAEKGYYLLGWGDVGYIYFFSNKPIRRPQDLASTKMWVWSDPIVSALAEFAGASPISLGVPDVLPNLTTGLIDTVYASPLAALSLQWATKTKYIENLPWQIGVGAAIIRKDAMDALKGDSRQALTAVINQWFPRMQKKIRIDNNKSIHKLKSLGLQIVKVNSEDRKAWVKMAKFVEKKVGGSYLSEEVITKIHKALAEIRK